MFINRRGIAKEGYWSGPTGETATWVSEYGSVAFSLLGREFAWSGMNEAGLAVSTMELRMGAFPEPDERPPLSVPSWAQYVLDTCGSVQEVIALDSLVRVQDVTPNHYLVVDASGDCVAIEWLDGQFVYYTSDDLPIKALANAPYAAGIAYIDHGAIPPANPGQSVERVAAAADMIERFGEDPDASPVDYSLQVLTETVVAPKKWWSNLFNEPYTRWSIVYDIAQRQVHFRTVESPAVKYLALTSFDLACDASVVMLDVNAELAGNVEQSFKPYDYEINLKVFREFCERWGVEVSKGDAIELMRLFESFECAP